MSTDDAHQAALKELRARPARVTLSVSPDPWRTPDRTAYAIATSVGDLLDAGLLDANQVLSEDPLYVPVLLDSTPRQLARLLRTLAETVDPPEFAEVTLSLPVEARDHGDYWERAREDLRVKLLRDLAGVDRLPAGPVEVSVDEPGDDFFRPGVTLRARVALLPA